MSRILILILIISCVFSACEETDNTVGDYAPRVEVLDPNTDISLEVPVLRVGVGIESGDFGLSWTACANAEKYEIEENSFLYGQRIVYLGNGLYYYVGDVNPQYPLGFRIRAINGLKVSRWSNPVYVPG